MADTVIVHGNDLIWKDRSLPNNRRLCPFKRDPIGYFIDLAEQGWEIIIYFSYTDYELRKFQYPELQQARNLLLEIVEQIRYESHGIASFRNFEDINFNRLSSTSFIIADEPRPTYKEIAQYTPFEIFGDNEFPHIEGVNVIINNYPPRAIEIIDLLQNKNYRVVSLNYERRKSILQEIIKGHPETNIVEIYSPVYKYPPDVRTADILPGIYELSAYEEKNPVFIPVSHYEYGY